MNLITVLIQCSYKRYAVSGNAFCLCGMPSIMVPVRSGDVFASIWKCQHQGQAAVCKCLTLDGKSQYIFFSIADSLYFHRSFFYRKAAAKHAFCQIQLLINLFYLLWMNFLSFPPKSQPCQVQTVGIFSQPVVNFFISRLRFGSIVFRSFDTLIRCFLHIFRDGTTHPGFHRQVCCAIPIGSWYTEEQTVPSAPDKKSEVR